MINPREKTTIGGICSQFESTCWTEILEAKTLDTDRKRQRINEILGKYWKPVYCYLRRKGYDNERAKDLTQGFFYDIIVGRHLLEQAKRGEFKGRFRSFLVTALDRYVTDVYRKDTAQKRTPEEGMVSLDTGEMTDWLAAHSDLEPDQAFQYAWACEVINQVLDQVQCECVKSGKTTHWKAFYARVVSPLVEGGVPRSIPDVCGEYGIKDEATASNMIFYVKDRFRAAMRHCLRQFVQSDSEVDQEFEEILLILSGRAKR
jgi:DNA-directed RNA polymerase specialized sigma24 family protein